MGIDCRGHGRRVGECGVGITYGEVAQGCISLFQMKPSALVSVEICFDIQAVGADGALP